MRTQAAMQTLLLAVRNIVRHRRRTLLTLVSTLFGVVAIVLSGGFVEDTIVELGESMIHSNSGHMQVSRHGFFEFGAHHPERYWIERPDQLRESLTRVTGVKDVMMRIRFSGLLGNGRSDWTVQGDGIEPDREARLGTYVTLSAGRQLESDDRFGMLIGHGVARALKLKPGDWATLTVAAQGGATNVLEFEVIGVFQTSSKDYDARTVRIPLPAAQSLLAAQGAHVAVVSLAATELTGTIAQAVEAALPPGRYETRTWQALNDFYGQTVTLYRYLFGFLMFIVMVLLMLSATSMINMSVFERMSEFGTLLALGNTRRQVFRLIVAECALLGLLGSSLGVAAGFGLAEMISAIGIPMPPPPNADLGYIAKVRAVPGVLAMAMVTGMLAVTLAALLPARLVSHADIPEALRRGI